MGVVEEVEKSERLRRWVRKDLVAAVWAGMVWYDCVGPRFGRELLRERRRRSLDGKLKDAVAVAVAGAAGCHHYEVLCFLQPVGRRVFCAIGDSWGRVSLGRIPRAATL